MEVSAPTDLTEQEAPVESEELSVEEPVQEGPEAALPLDETEELIEDPETPVEDEVDDGELTPEEALREQQVAAARKKRDAKIVWTVIGVASVLLLVAIPVAMRRRY